MNDRWSNALRAAAAAIPLPDYASQPDAMLAQD
jgi:putative proteasome-type protease